MAKYAVNDDAVRHARTLVDARRYVLRSRWGDVQPTAADGTRAFFSPSPVKVVTRPDRAP